MKTRGIIAEDFVNYKLPSLFISTAYCDFKCCKEGKFNKEVCQNAPLLESSIRDIPIEIIYDNYINNPITKAVVIGGLEPMLQFNEVYELIYLFRSHNVNCPFVIYTGHYPPEIENKLQRLKYYNNIIVKFGRYIPNRPSRFDLILGVTLASDNQYAEVIS